MANAPRKAAIYARYSSDNQKPTSIDDQVLACSRFATERGIVVLRDHVYEDRAQSGTRRDRQGLLALIDAAPNRLFDLVLVDDLSRLSRDLAFMLDLVQQFRFLDVGIVSVADGLDTLDENTILQMQIKGVFAEYVPRDLRQKTFRGQRGRKESGFFVGEATFGYSSEPAGPLSKDNRGKLRPAGYLMRINPVQEAVVRRIFQDFADGHAMTRIVRDLNAEGVPGSIRSRGGWSVATISRMLANTKYIGIWPWNKTHNLRNGEGKRHCVANPESDWVVTEDEALRIVDQKLWDAVSRRREEVRRTWPGGPGRSGFSSDQRARVDPFPPHLLSSAMVCACCGSKVGLVSGKGSGYYGCFAAYRRACDNRVLGPRRLAEDIILRSVCKRLLEPKPLLHVLQRVEEEAQRLHPEIPAALRLKTLDLKAKRKTQANYVAFVAQGEGTKAVAEALAELELQIELLACQVTGLQRASNNVIRVPSERWLRDRLSSLRSVLELRTHKSAALLRRLLCPIRLEPVKPAVGRPYYVARTALDVLVLLDDPESEDSSDSGAKSLRWWTRSQRLRTIAQVLIEAELLRPVEAPVYQSIAADAAAMHERGAPVSGIAKHFGLDHHTAAKALRWFRSR